MIVHKCDACGVHVRDANKVALEEWRSCHDVTSTEYDLCDFCFDKVSRFVSSMVMCEKQHGWFNND